MSIEDEALLESVDKFISEWQFARGLSRDLLATLSSEQLEAAPLAGAGPLWKQFRHIGRVQEDYISAIHTGTVRFTTDGKGFAGKKSVSALKSYLKACDEALLSEIRTMFSSRSEAPVINWFGEHVRVNEHLWRLYAHETFHHGQWVLYMRALEGEFPSSWSAWGV